MRNTLNLVGSLEGQGFVPTVHSEQRFNVVCVTKRAPLNGDATFHLPVPGNSVVLVKRMLYTRADININRTVVVFNGKDYDLGYIRNGLSGSALVIGIHCEDCSPYTEWELYTDTPSANSDHPQETVTSAMLQLRAQEAIRRHGNG